MDACIRAIESANPKTIQEALAAFIIEFATTFETSEPFYQRERLVEKLFKWLSEADQSPAKYQALQCLRIMTRDKRELDRLFTADRVDTLLEWARLQGDHEPQTTAECPEFDARLVLEAQKCLCNLVYNSQTIQRLCVNNNCVNGLMLRLRTYKDPHLPTEVKYFDMRTLFILTALCPEIRVKVHEQYHGFIYLMEVVDLLLKQTAEPGQRPSKKSQRRKKRSDPIQPTPAADESAGGRALDDLSVDLCCEVLKVLFNLSFNVDKTSPDDVGEAQFIRLVGILHDLLLTDTQNKEKRYELQNHIVNLFNNTPARCFDELLVPIHEIGRLDNPRYEYEDMNVEALAVLLEFLDRRLKMEHPNAQAAHVSLAPILSCFCEMGKSNSVIRKYLRTQVLPPLRDVMNRPEQGDSLRNRLVKLMTAPNTEIKELVAEFLFILCKENVGRLIKYTGYGNAAGLLANRGLMLGGRGRGNYSSDSEDSDTEEYLKMKDKINPVTGCYEEPKPNPMDGMSEEQKEFEAMQLVQMIDKLQKGGVVQPCRVGEDGKPVPVGHILELQGTTPAVKNVVSDSDSD